MINGIERDKFIIEARSLLKTGLGLILLLVNSNAPKGNPSRQAKRVLSTTMYKVSPVAIAKSFSIIGNIS